VFGRPVPAEHPDRPFTGFKLARAVLSVDGQRAGFAGLSIGARSVYGVTAEAACVWNRRHVPPKRWCRCGFYCLSTLADARALSCATENRAAVLLEVVASGRFIRYERGLRYSRQRLSSAQVGPCTCGRRSVVLADDGRGFVGWRCLRPSCGPCSTDRAFLSIDQFAARLDEPIPVAADPGGIAPGAEVLSRRGLSAPVPGRPGRGLGAQEQAARGAGTPGAPDPGKPVPDQTPESASIAVLAAEIALLQARLDDLQAQVNGHHGGRGPGL